MRGAGANVVMNIFCKAAFLAVFGSTQLWAQEEIDPMRMVEILEKTPIFCTFEEDNQQDCNVVEEYNFFTETRGFLIGTGIMRISEKEYIRMTFTEAVQVTNKGFCSTGSQAIKDAHLEVVREVDYLGNFRRYDLEDDLREFLQKQVLNPMIALFETSTSCVRFFSPQNPSKPNEIEYTTYLDDEVLESGRGLLLNESDAYRLKLKADE